MDIPWDKVVLKATQGCMQKATRMLRAEQKAPNLPVVATEVAYLTAAVERSGRALILSLIHISEPTRLDVI
eukprot:1976108-Prorocentrum_lima.AAC.1